MSFSVRKLLACLAIKKRPQKTASENKHKLYDCNLLVNSIVWRTTKRDMCGAFKKKYFCDVCLFSKFKGNAESA